MPKNVNLYNLLISCPGDVTSEIKIINDVVSDFNDRFTDTLGILLKTMRWSKNSYAQSGGKPQTLLNEQFVKDCDVAVAIFWTRFGTPTDEYGSGTEEEIELMLKSEKQVFMYFCDKPIEPSKMNSEEYARVKRYRESYSKKGLYYTYSSDEDFKRVLFAHLSEYFLSLKEVNKLKEERKPQLSICGINEKNKLINNALIQPFTLNTDCSVQKYENQIEQIYREIINMAVYKRRKTVENDIMSTICRTVKFDDNRKKELLEKTAKKFNINLPDYFFELGNLSRNTLQTYQNMNDIYLGNSRDEDDLVGSVYERKKYYLLNDLYTIIQQYEKWKLVEERLFWLKCIKLAIKNTGTNFDEDVEIKLTISKNSLLTIREFPPIVTTKEDLFAIGALLDEYDMYDLFEIKDTAEYLTYEDSIMQTSNTLNNNSLVTDLPFGFRHKDIRKEYEKTLMKIFDYVIYDDNENYILKFKFDYIKHLTSVAFPAPIFVKNNLKIIEYKITSKNSVEEIDGFINIDECQ